MSILHRAIQELNSEFITLATTNRVKDLLLEAIAEIEEFRSKFSAKPNQCTDCWSTFELLDILVGEEEQQEEDLLATAKMQVVLLTQSLAMCQSQANAAKITAREAAKVRRDAEDALDEARQEEDAAKDDINIIDKEIEELEAKLRTAKAMIH